MNRIAQSIKNRLSLRPPQADSLNILAELTDKLTLKKHTPCPSQEGNTLSSEREIVKTSYPTCTDFERNFPSICFSLATGVGKTRLMGAFVVYLYLSKGIKNFFILAPNITIYNKLIEDFSNSTSPKYVFQGIGEFVHRQPRIITGDTYNTIAQTTFFRSEVHINVFNISKINAILGWELTATPQVERSGGTIKFKNVVYEYSLAKAIKDGFVKEPAVATRKDFDPGQYTPEDLDRIKLEDGIRIHEDTKVALDIFARDSRMPVVKPFMLVVAKDTEHAGRLKELIVYSAFFEGRYADKVMEIHSNQSGDEKDENIAQLLSLESPDNRIEIVIHVNMLKEGWDVTNLYTIIPLRTAGSTTLREQTIGRGLRLPYGERTGSDKVDKLTIVSHDRFQEIVDAANRPDSIIRKENIITIDAEELSHTKEVITSVPLVEKK